MKRDMKFLEEVMQNVQKNQFSQLAFLNCGRCG
jgi:hypothetical protein